MKEIIAIIRPEKLSQTKKVLEEMGFPAYTCRRVMGRGKKLIDTNLLQSAIEQEEVSATPLSDYIASTSRLIPKRFFTLIIQDENVKDAINAIIEANYEGNPGDGKIFVLPVYESIRVRDGELQTDADTY